MSKVYSPLAIARYFLERGDVNHTKIHKLVYLAYCFHMAAHGVPPLTYEQPEAWKRSPVFSSLYRRFSGFVDEAIPAEVCLDSAPTKEDKRTTMVLQLITDWYGEQTGYQLSELTHRKGTPWEQTKILYGVIDYHLITSYYNADEFKPALEYLRSFESISPAKTIQGRKLAKDELLFNLVLENQRKLNDILDVLNKGKLCVCKSKKSKSAKMCSCGKRKPC